MTPAEKAAYLAALQVKYDSGQKLTRSEFVDLLVEHTARGTAGELRASASMGYAPNGGASEFQATATPIKKAK